MAVHWLCQPLTINLGSGSPADGDDGFQQHRNRLVKRQRPGGGQQSGGGSVGQNDRDRTRRYGGGGRVYRSDRHGQLGDGHKLRPGSKCMYQWRNLVYYGRSRLSVLWASGMH